MKAVIKFLLFVCAVAFGATVLLRLEVFSAPVKSAPTVWDGVDYKLVCIEGYVYIYAYGRGLAPKFNDRYPERCK